jgi:hypothetical protein
VSGDAHIAWLARQRSAWYMAYSLPEDAFIGSLGKHRGDAQPRDLNSADQSVGGDGWQARGKLGWSCILWLQRTFPPPQPPEFRALSFLVKPRACQSEHTVAERYAGGGEQDKLAPPQNGPALVSIDGESRRRLAQWVCPAAGMFAAVM